MDTRRAITVTTCHYRKYKRISSLPSGEPPSGLRAQIARVPTLDKTKTEAGNESVGASVNTAENASVNASMIALKSASVNASMIASVNAPMIALKSALVNAWISASVN